MKRVLGFAAKLPTYGVVAADLKRAAFQQPTKLNATGAILDSLAFQGRGLRTNQGTLSSESLGLAAYRRSGLAKTCLIDAHTLAWLCTWWWRLWPCLDLDKDCI